MDNLTDCLLEPLNSALGLIDKHAFDATKQDTRFHLENLVRKIQDEPGQALIDIEEIGKTVSTALRMNSAVSNSEEEVMSDSPLVEALTVTLSRVLLIRLNSDPEKEANELREPEPQSNDSSSSDTGEDFIMAA